MIEEMEGERQSTKDDGGGDNITQQTKQISVRVNKYNLSQRHCGGWSLACALCLCLSLFDTNTEVPLNNPY